jgi:hypothetical protein
MKANIENFIENTQSLHCKNPLFIWHVQVIFAYAKCTFVMLANTSITKLTM